jgi:hypothetical protein
VDFYSDICIIKQKENKAINISITLGNRTSLITRKSEKAEGGRSE